MKMTPRHLHRRGCGRILCLLACIVMLGRPGQTEKVCDQSYDGSRGEAFSQPEDALYKSPLNLLLSPDEKHLYVVCERTNEVMIVDITHGRIVSSIPTGELPFGLALSPDGATLYVSNRRDDSVTLVSTTDTTRRETMPVGDDPHGLITDSGGRFLYVANMGTDDISVFDMTKRSEVKRLAAGTAPFDLAMSTDGLTLFASSQLSLPVPFRTPPVLEMTVIDTAENIVTERRTLHSTVLGQGIAPSPEGDLVVMALECPKNLIPETQIYQGWMVTHGFAVIETRHRGRAALCLLDDVNRYYADPFDVVFSPDGRYLFISSSAVDTVSVIDMSSLRTLLKIRDGTIGLDDQTLSLYARHLGLSTQYVIARIPTGTNPKGMAITADGRHLFVANRLSDSITVIDAQHMTVIRTIDLGGPKIETLLRRGERLLNFASISFQKQLSCTTCHPENNLDGLVYDIAIDGGMGRNLVDNRTLRGIADTAPFKWSGKNPDLYRQEGPRAAQLFFRSHGFSKEDNEAIVRYIESIPFEKNRYAPRDGVLNEFQKLGKSHFHRATTTDGRYIPHANRCITCHPPPLYTDRLLHDVGTKAYFDTSGLFDTPQLVNLHEQRPYLHDGRCYSLEEIWTVFNPDDLHGVTNDMKKEQLNELVEYMRLLPFDREPIEGVERMANRDDTLPMRSATGDGATSGSRHDGSPRFVGSETCGACHVVAWQKWLGSRHARAWITLQSESARTIAMNAGMASGSPQQERDCLRCHGPLESMSAVERGPEARTEEGVTCEACHGPAEFYNSAHTMRDRPAATAAGLIMPADSNCQRCHVRPDYHGPTGTPFNSERALTAIDHRERKGP